MRFDKTITVFGSGRIEPGSEGYEVAMSVGASLAKAHFNLCNGGYAGTMEAAARGAAENGGFATGVTLKKSSSAPNNWLDEVLPVDNLTTRICTLLDRGDGYIILPGGTGTLAEIGMMLEFMNKDLIDLRPAVFLGDYWVPLLNIIRDEGIARGENEFEPARGIEQIGNIALAESASAAVNYLSENLHKYGL